MSESSHTAAVPTPVDDWIDPVIEAYKAGIDRTIIRHNLTLTVEQRIDGLRDLMRSIEAMQEVGRRARERG